jgi:hypothetical protein
MPCHHIASVCLKNESIIGKDPKGFPLSSKHIFWWSKYYLYGKSHKPDPQKTKKALIALVNDNTQGLQHKKSTIWTKLVLTLLGID